MKGVSRWFLWGVVLLLSGCGDPEPIRIGFIGGISGSVSDLGQSGRNGALLALEAFNEAGGYQGQLIELVARDDHQDPDQARAMLAELSAQRIKTVIGPMTSAMAVALVPELESRRMFMLSPTVTTTQLSDQDDLFFRVVNSVAGYAQEAAAYTFQQSGLRRVAVAYDTRNAAYTETWLAHFKAAYATQGGEILVEVPFDSGQIRSYDGIVAELLAPQPEALLLIASAVDTALLAIAARQRAEEPVALVGTPWAATEALTELGGEAVEGLLMPQFFNRYLDTGGYQRFKRAYEKRFKQSPGFASVAGYDAANVLIEVIRSEGPDADFKQAILARREFPGLQQATRFNLYGDAERPVFMTRIVNGRHQVVQ